MPITAAMLYNLVSCPHRLTMDAFTDPALRDEVSPFVQLLEAVHEVDGLRRLRFTSPHPIGFREDLIDALARLPKLAAHVHLPLQSGSDRMLKAMHRAYTA